jgi:DNA-binding NtrC family response regulator
MVSVYQPFIGSQKGNNNSNSDGNGSMPIPGRAPETFARKKRILHVEFDRVLLTTRHALLETAGFDVISCFSGTAAREVSAGCSHFDLFLMGHAASMAERTDLITWIRAQFPGIAIVVLRSRDTDFSPAGDALSVADPDELLKAIVDVLKVR